MLYSKNNGFPEEIPNRIRLSSGLTRTGKDYTDEELADAGYKLVGMQPTCSQGQVVEWDYETGEWCVRTKTIEELIAEADIQWEEIRHKRNMLLKDTDWTQLPDAFNGHLKTTYSRMWSEYRQALRDITKYTSPQTVAWPVMPTIESVTEQYNAANKSINQRILESE